MGTDTVLNALLKPSSTLPAMDLIGPTADDDIRRAIGRYGPEAVKKAVKRQTAAKRGRPKLNDWKALGPIITHHAHLWLQGEDPFTISDYAIAKAYADAIPGQSATSTFHRVRRKLKAKRGRKWFTLVVAESESRDRYPYTTHIRALKALVELEPDGVWKDFLEWAEGHVADYIRWHGQPDEGMTIKQIEEGARPLNALGRLEKSSSEKGGLFGLLGCYANDTDKAGNAA